MSTTEATLNASQSLKESSPGVPKPQRVRTYTRPRAFPSSIRRKLTLLGHPPPTKETSTTNLTYLVDRLTTDLNNYRALADHWQQKFSNLESSTSEERAALVLAEAPKAPLETFVIFNPNSRPSNDDLLSYTAHTMGRLHSTANPSLSLVELGAPKLNSNAYRFIGDSCFYTIIAAVDFLAALNYVPPTAENPYPNLPLVKSDFNLPRALRFWQDAFEPMNFHPSKLHFSASSSCRSDLEKDLYEDDIDHFDQVLTRASDFEIVEMLHYATILLTGMHQAVFDDPSLAPARLHLGKACERLLREAIFTRNLTSNNLLAQGLADGMLRSFCYFGPEERSGAISSMLELAWPMCASRPEGFFPSLAPFLCFFGLVLAPTEGKRATWAKRIEANLADGYSSRCFPSILWSHFGAAYNALLAKDESTFLPHATALEELLERKPLAEGLDERWDMAAMQPILALQDSAFSQNGTSERLYFKVYPEASPHVVSTGNFMNDVRTTVFLSSPSEDDDFTLGSGSTSSYDITQPPYLDDYGTPYTPGEKLKTLYRIPLQIMRAEASLLFQDYESCMHWVDVAEASLADASYTSMMQRVFLMKNVIKDTCPFPTGTRSVVDEIERRIIAYDTARSIAPQRERVLIGALWRTP